MNNVWYLLYYCDLLKIGPPQKISPPLFQIKLLQRVLFSLKSTLTYLCCSTCCYAKQETLKNQCHEEDGLTNEGRHHLLSSA